MSHIASTLVLHTYTTHVTHFTRRTLTSHKTSWHLRVTHRICTRVTHDTFTSYTSCHLCVTADPTWGDIFESSFRAQSSKLEHVFSLKRGKRDVWSLSFKLWNSLRKMSLRVGSDEMTHSQIHVTHRIYTRVTLTYSHFTHLTSRHLVLHRKHSHRCATHIASALVLHMTCIHLTHLTVLCHTHHIPRLRVTHRIHTRLTSHPHSCYTWHLQMLHISHPAKSCYTLHLRIFVLHISSSTRAPRHKYSNYTWCQLSSYRALRESCHTHANQSCHIYMCDVTHPYVWHD